MVLAPLAARFKLELSASHVNYKLFGFPIFRAIRSIVRESCLSCNNKKLVYARTVIPRKTLKVQNHTLTRLGKKPLGEVLFNNNKIFRENIKYAKIPLYNELHNKAKKHCDIYSDLYGRQSIFYVKNKPLLLIEVFLPDIMI